MRTRAVESFVWDESVRASILTTDTLLSRSEDTRSFFVLGPRFGAVGTCGETQVQDLRRAVCSLGPLPRRGFFGGEVDPEASAF